MEIYNDLRYKILANVEGTLLKHEIIYEAYRSTK